jgi:putative hydrolase
MCLLEGYSNHVMDVVGSTLLPTYPFMKRRFEARHQNRSTADRIFARLTGLDLKLEQYVLGEKFVNNVVGSIGIDRFNQVWEGPASLPTMPEIYEPERWRARLAV